MDPQKKQKKFKNFLKSVDIYSKPIQLTYKGRENFRTSFGGLLSMAVILTIVSAFIYNLRDLVLRNQTQVKKNTLVSASNSYVPPENLSERNITFAFSLSDFYAAASFDDPYYGSLVLTQLIVTIKKNEADGTSYRDFQEYEIPYSKCELGRNIFYSNKEEIDQFAIEKYYCPDWQNLTLQGNWNSPVHSRVQLLFKRCTGTNCSTDAEFESWMSKATLQEIFISTYFDIDNYENPIKYFTQDYFISLQPDKSVVNTIYFKKNNLDLNDNIFGLFITKSYDYFYQVSKNEEFLSDPVNGPGEGVYLYQLFKLDREYDSYERDVYTVVGVLKDVGGFYNSLFFAGLFIYTKFRINIYFSSLISKLYSIDYASSLGSSTNDTMNQSSNNTSRVHFLQNKKSPRSTPRNSTVQSQNLGNEYAKLYMSKQLLKSKLTNSLKITQNTLEMIKDYLRFRWRIKFTYKEVIKMTMAKVCCCKKQDSQKGSKTFSKLAEEKYKVLQQGEKKLLKDLDCINILHKLRLLDHFSSLFLNDYQRYLLNFSKKTVIKDNYYESSSDEETCDIRDSINTFASQRNRNIEDTKLEEALNLVAKKSWSTKNQKIIYSLISNNPQKCEFMKKVVKTKEITKLHDQLSFANEAVKDPKFDQYEIQENKQNKPIKQKNLKDRKKQKDSQTKVKQIIESHLKVEPFSMIQSDNEHTQGRKPSASPLKLNIDSVKQIEAEIKSSQRRLNNNNEIHTNQAQNLDVLEDFEQEVNKFNAYTVKSYNKQYQQQQHKIKSEKSKIFQTKTFDL